MRLNRQARILFARNALQKLLSPAFPCAVVMPSSAISARKALITWVRCRIKRSRVRCSINWLCCSAALTRTKRMVGRRTGHWLYSL
jgi:hypothetical protein